jgi:hypothetical protein
VAYGEAISKIAINKSAANESSENGGGVKARKRQ